jgi:hypothetical protein
VAVDPSKVGRDWRSDELDAIVADYFAMLELELTGQSYVKAQHTKALMERTGRSHRSVEFKHMNISAVLKELGRPTIRGYTPMPNVQGAIFDAIDRYLATNPRALELAPPPFEDVSDSRVLFEETPPELQERERPKSQRLERLVRKFDPALRDFRNRSLGLAGEALVVEHERAKLVASERPDLARMVRWVSQEDGDGAGYDIRSYEPSGTERLIEVKTTYGARTTPFFLTRNEFALSGERPDVFRIFRLYDFAEIPKMFQLHPPLEEVVNLEVDSYMASFRK